MYAKPKETSSRIMIGFRLVEALRDFLEGVGAYVKAERLNWQIQCVDADQFADLLNRSTVAGAIAVVGARSTGQIRRLVRSRMPMVNVLQDLSPHVTSVMSDDIALGRSGAEHLLACGFTRFGYLGLDVSWSHEREKGFAATLASVGMESVRCEAVAKGTFLQLESAHSTKLLRRWVARLPKPIAILACSDTAARILLNACEMQQIHVPEQVAILGVDNLVATCELSSVSLSSVAQDFPRLGFEAARQLHRLLRGRIAPKKRILIPPGSVVVRRSTDVFVFADEYVTAAMRLIHERASEGGIMMKDLLREIPVSRRWLDQRFKDLVGHTVSQEIRQRRAQLVRDLLLRTDLSLKQITQRCHFPSGENMTRFFRNAYGLPPHTYRLRNGVPQ